MVVIGAAHAVFAMVITLGTRGSFVNVYRFCVYYRLGLSIAAKVFCGCLSPICYTKQKDSTPPTPKNYASSPFSTVLFSKLLLTGFGDSKISASCSSVCPAVSTNHFQITKASTQFQPTNTR